MQPTPIVSAADVIRIAARDFPNNESVALAALARYGTAPWHRERYRVQIGILKIANGDIGRLEAATEVACGDYRDVLTAAEYAAYAAFSVAELDDKELERQAIDRDLREFNEWFCRV
jgi:hypothetical protein